MYYGDHFLMLIIFYTSLQMSPKRIQNVSKTSPKRLQNVSKCLQNVSIETFSPYRLHQSLIPNVPPERADERDGKQKSTKCIRSMSCQILVGDIIAIIIISSLQKGIQGSAAPLGNPTISLPTWVGVIENPALH